MDIDLTRQRLEEVERQLEELEATIDAQRERAVAARERQREDHVPAGGIITRILYELFRPRG